MKQKKMTAILLAGAMILSNVPVMAAETEFQGQVMEVGDLFQSEPEAEMLFTSEPEPDGGGVMTSEGNEITSETTTWQGGNSAEAAVTYVANGSVEISGRVTVTGHVILQLSDGCKLNAKQGINVGSGNSLTIRGNGNLTATGGDSGAGIGGGDSGAGGMITIEGGTVTAQGGNYGAGIGGGGYGDGGTIKITGGTVTAQGGKNGAGIGGGSDGNGGEITIEGGTVTVTGGEYGAGIGGGNFGAGGEITIEGGTVTAQGGESGAGIGGGDYGAGGTIKIEGGTVTAQGGRYGAGIGGGSYRSGETIKITGGTVTATGGEYGAGIGGGYDEAGGTITITGGAVTATGGNGGAGIGGGCYGSGGNFSTGEEGTGPIIYASNISDLSKKDSWRGIIFEGQAGEVYGAGFTIPEGSTLTIPKESTLTIPEGATLTNTGAIDGSGTIRGLGTLQGMGTIASTIVVENTVNWNYTVAVKFQDAEGTPLTNNEAPYGSDVKIQADVARPDGRALQENGVVDFYLGEGEENPLNKETIRVAADPNNPSKGSAVLSLTINEEQWKPSETPYSILAVYKLLSVDPTVYEEKARATETLTVKKAGQEAPPDALELQFVTENAIELKPLTVDPGKTVEYGFLVDGAESKEILWQLDTKFKNLSSGTGYTCYARYQGDDYYEPSPASSVKVYTIPKITTASLPKGTVGSSYQTTLATEVGEAVTWSVTDRSLPAGLSLDPGTGVISGTPTSSGTTSFTVQAKIGQEPGHTAEAQKALTLEIESRYVPQPSQKPLPENVPEGSKWEGENLVTPNGTVLKPDGTIVLPDGTALLPQEGNKPSIDPEGTVTTPDGIRIDKEGNITVPGLDKERAEDDVTVTLGTEGRRPALDPEAEIVTAPEGGRVILLDGQGNRKEIEIPEGTVVTIEGLVTLPDGTLIRQDGKVHRTDGSIWDLYGNVIRPGTPVMETAETPAGNNKVEAVLAGECAGAMGYDYVISENPNCIVDKDYYQIDKNQLETVGEFTYIQEGTYYVYCHAWTRNEENRKVFSKWSNGAEVEVTAKTPKQPQIRKVAVSKNKVTVTYTKTAGAEGYDLVLGKALKKVNGELRPVDYGKAVKKVKNKNTVTVTFQNVPKGTYYVGLHAYNRTSEDGKKVFSPWSKAKKIRVR